MVNTLYFGDNLDILRTCIDDASVDLIYLDPPFNSQAQYNLLFERPRSDMTSAQAGAFLDTWRWGEEAELSLQEVMRAGGLIAKLVEALRSAFRESDMMAYLVMMAVRLQELHRKLKPEGALYLHCDPTASHYLKTMLDGVFGPENFLNEIVWRRTNARGTKGRWPRVHDVLLYYAKGPRFRFNPQLVKGDLAKTPHTLITGPDGEKYQTYELTAPGVTKDGESGRSWRGYDPTKMGRHWGNSHSTMNEWDERGLIHWPKNDGFPRRRDDRPFDPEARMVTIGDVWTDIDRLNQTAKERLGYPTQKPIALLERIIAASSRPGDLVLDPFCGCGTTIEAAERAKRRWIGIDVAVHAIKLIEARLERIGSVAKYRIEGMPRDFDSALRLAERDKYQFQWWANYLFNPHAIREQKKGADRGIDGELFFPNGPGRPWGRMLTSVKGGENIGPAEVREFARVLDREKADLGLFICLRAPKKSMIAEASLGIANTVHGEIPRLQIVAIEDWFKGRLPKLPPLEHLPSAALGTTRRRARPAPKRPDPKAPQLPLVFTGGKHAPPERHWNPSMVESVQLDDAELGAAPRAVRAIGATAEKPKQRGLLLDEPLLTSPQSGKHRRRRVS